MPSASIHYFSGTGNTYRAIKIIERKLASSGYKVKTIRLDKDTVPPETASDLNVFGFPVYAYDMPGIMLKYIKNMPSGNNSKAAIIAVHGAISADPKIPGGDGDPGYSYDHARTILSSKGYDVFFTNSVGYPHSITTIIEPPGVKDQDEIRKVSDIKVKEFADKISEGQQSLKKCPSVYKIFSPISGFMYGNFGRRFFGKIYIADGSCNSCGKCVKACPVNAIMMINKKPRWNWNCQGCQRCINICPKNAIQTSVARILFQVLMMLPAIYLGFFYIPEKLTMFPEGISGLITGILLCIVLYVALLFIFEKLMYSLEMMPIVRSIIRFNWTGKFRRYLDPDFSRSLK
jgi:ferredoxin